MHNTCETITFILKQKRKQNLLIMLEPTLKSYSEIKEVFIPNDNRIIQLIINDKEYADEWVYRNRWDLFDMPVDDELLFDYRDVEDIQDMAHRYLESKNILQ